MCWRIYNRPLEKLIAKENVPIFKVCTKSTRFSNTVESYFMNYCYQLGIVYELDCITPHNWINYFEINAGFHSYLADCVFINHIVFSPAIRRWIRSYRHNHAVQVNGYIPKGSEYYVNENGECVSNKICLIEIEEL